MKANRFVVVAILIVALGTVTTWAQATRWRITNGDGFGVLLDGTGNSISDSEWGAFGVIAQPDECSCVHYHGILFDEEDPNPNGCGWGCVEQVPVSTAQARTALNTAIANNTGTNAAFAAKLNSIADTAQGAIATKCSSLFEGAIDALGQEILGAFFNGLLSDPQTDAIVKALVNFAALGIEEMDLPFPDPPEPPKPCTVKLLSRRGSNSAAKLFEAKRKIFADPGEVVVLDAQGCPGDGPYEWEYKFKGGTTGSVPSGAGISFTPNRFCVLSERPTTVTVTVIFHCPDGKTVKDTATITIQ